MIRYQLERIDLDPGIPLWRLRLADTTQPAPAGGERGAPPVILQHGYTGAKEGLVTWFGPMLAQAGYDVLIPDAPLHGERRVADFEARFAADFRKTMFGVVREGADDFSRILDWTGAKEAGVVGISMGAFISYLAVTRDPRIKAAVPLIGSGDFNWGRSDDAAYEVEIDTINPALHPANFVHCALLIQHGALDELVPVDVDRSLHEILKPHYADRPERLRYIEYPHAAHEVPSEMIDETVAWLKRFLPV